MTSLVPSGGGILPVDKPAGPTSHDVVSVARRGLGLRRVGHTGTLDPFASGLLLLLVGPLTRLSTHLTGLDKRYTAVLRLGETTETDDHQGAVLEVRDGWQQLGAPELERALASFLGPQLQRPPRYSAKKVGGTPAHRRARRGEVVELPEAAVHIHGLELLGWTPPDLRFSALVGSGTYIRSLGRDLGAALGVGGHLVALRREAVGSVPVEGAVTLDDLRDGRVPAEAWLRPRDVLAHLPQFTPGEAALRDLRMGRPLEWPLEAGAAPPEGTSVMVLDGSQVAAMAAMKGDRLWPRTVFPPVGEGEGDPEPEPGAAREAQGA